MNKNMVISLVFCGLLTIIVILFIQLQNEKDDNQFNERVLDNNLKHYYEATLNIENTLSRYINNELKFNTFRELTHRDVKTLLHIQDNLQFLFHMQDLDLEFRNNINQMIGAFHYLQMERSSDYTQDIHRLVKQHNTELKVWFQASYDEKTRSDKLNEADEIHSQISNEIFEKYTQTLGENDD